MANNEAYNMIFADGTEIAVRPDGCGNWLSDDITEEMLTTHNLSHVVITENGNKMYDLSDQVCTGIYPYGETKGFFLRDMTAEEKMNNVLEIYDNAIAELAELIGG